MHCKWAINILILILLKIKIIRGLQEYRVDKERGGRRGPNRYFGKGKRITEGREKCKKGMDKKK